MMQIRATLVFLCLLVASPAARAGEIDIFPTGPVNPRVPVIAPQASDDPKHVLTFDAEFRYSLDSLLTFPQGGTLSFAFRDNLGREEKTLLSLTDGSSSITLHIAPAAKDRKTICEISIGNKPAGNLPLKRPESGWSRMQFQWTAKELVCLQDGKEFGRLPLHAAFNPTSLSVQSWYVSDVSLVGDGRFDLDWSDGYAGRLQPGQSAKGLVGRVFGFDTDVISLDPAKRDCPTLQLIDADAQPGQAVVKFELSSEVNDIKAQWTQAVQAQGQSQAITPIAFPVALPADVYHLTATSDTPGLSGRWHFLYVPRRSESPGLPKFGLHDSGVKTFGFWPDALPVDFAHVYAGWAYIQGPPWIKDFNGDWGIDPSLPPEQWNWNPKLDAIVQEGHLPYVCLESLPFQDWQRAKHYPQGQMVKYNWGWRGGAPNLDKYRVFLNGLMQRYKGKVWAYEIENEPNTSHGFEPDDYAGIAKTVYAAVKANDPQARVFGICGTSTFVDWMHKTFNAGAAAGMDGVSWHTYVTPATPEQANLAGLLADATKIASRYKADLQFFNSETGTYVAHREQVDQPISDARLEELVDSALPPLAVAKGWPSRAISERQGGISLVSNAVTNFLAGAQGFVFFGWNQDWPKNANWWGRTFDDSDFSMFSVSRDGQRTPSQFTLAAAVMTTQLEPAIHTHGQAVHDGVVRGAIFPKQSGGKVAVLWTTIGQQSVAIHSSQPQIECVSMLGQSHLRDGLKQSDGRYRFWLDLDEEPMYVHAANGEMSVQPAPIVVQISNPTASAKLQLTAEIRNTFDTTWEGKISLQNGQDWSADPTERPFSVKPGERKSISLELTPPPKISRGSHAVCVQCSSPDGSTLLASGQALLTPTFTIARLTHEINLADLKTASLAPLTIDRPEQVVVGRPPAMASLQESQYWAGPKELSGQAKVAADPSGLLVYVEVTDAHAKLPATWPSVGGSCIELFIDARQPDRGFHSTAYGPGVHQLVLRPALDDKSTVAVWNVTKDAELDRSLRADGGRIDDSHYWVAIKLPWKAIEMSPQPERPIALDIGIDGAGPAGGRKSQLMLFGHADDNRNASLFGLGYIAKAPQ